MTKILSVFGLALMLATGTVSIAHAEEKKGADELAVEGLTKLLDALSIFIDSIPQYETPEVLDNGDIIIRRKKTTEEEEPSDKDKSGVEKTST